MRVLLVATEASAEFIGARLLRALRDRGVTVDARGIVGRKLIELGVQPLADGSALNVVGFLDPFLQLRKLYQYYRALAAEFRRRPSQLVILIDQSGFNLKIAALARKHRVPVLFVVSPQIWAWRAGRLKKILATVDHMIVLYPFEVEIYRAASVPVTMMTHPLVSLTREGPTKPDARRTLGLTEEQLIFVMMPGSRDSEIKAHAPELARIAKRLSSLYTNAAFLVPLARQEQVESFRRGWMLGTESAPAPIIRVGSAQTMIAAADLAVVTSGTATLQVALTGRPAVVIYRTNLLSYTLARMLVRVRYVALPNLLLNRPVYPEFIQGHLQTEPICQTIRAILADEGREQQAELARLRPLLQGATDEQIAAIAVRLASH
jgi:lipid-A-disaccharide synthase